MILLDSNHLTVLGFPDSPRAKRLIARLDVAIERPIGTTIVNVEESMRGWLATIAKERSVLRQVSPYRELGELFDFFAGLDIVLLNELAAKQFASLSSQISAMDRKIAAIALVTDSLLLTANRRDFERVPGLRFENWLD